LQRKPNTDGIVN